jgi:putative endonuclease
VVEGARLESVYAGNCIEGSNPFLSANRKAMKNGDSTFYVYVLQSLKDFSFYIGQCDDLDKRMSKHTDGFSKYTASKRPLRLVYFELITSRSEALRREKQIKKMKSKIYIENLIKNWKNK